MRRFVFIILIGFCATQISAQTEPATQSSSGAVKIINAPPVKLQPYTGNTRKNASGKVQIVGTPAAGGPEIKSHQAVLSPQQPGKQPHQGKTVVVESGKNNSTQQPIVKSLSAPMRPVTPGNASPVKKRIIQQP